MTIDFQCTKCNAAMSSPDGTAGKKGRCPSCGEIQQIPGEPVGTPAASSDTITIKCTSCGDELTVPASHAGKKGRCPTCETINQIPGGTTTSSSRAATPTSEHAAPTNQGTAKVTFNCEHCHQQITVPKSAAGKKGRCPGCSKVVVIPGGSAKSAPAASQPNASQPVGSNATLANGKLTFACPKCSQSITVPEAVAGKKGKCPQCSEVIGIPSAPARPTTPIEFRCPTCNRAVKTPGSSAGKKGKCPGCQMVFDIPMSSTITKQPTPAPGLTPATGGLTPVAGNTGLAPIPSQGLTPVAPTQGGLTPVGGSGGLTPVGPSPGLTPVGGGGGLTPVGPIVEGLTPVGGGLTPAPSSNPYLSGGAANIPSVGDPLGLGGLGTPNSFGETANSYAAPSYTTSTPSHRRGRKKSLLVQIPAGIMMGVCGLFIVLRIVQLVSLLMAEGTTSDFNNSAFPNNDLQVAKGIGALVFVGFMVLDAAILFGYVQMFIARRYAIGIVALVCSLFLHVFPGCCCTLPLGLPLNFIAVVAVIVGFVGMLMEDGKRSFVD